ncbi:hypothetical protein [Caldicoprobacter algeriensis]|nr:hypothetical protein [Caldicoprobacter algeriensis]
METTTTVLHNVDCYLNIMPKCRRKVLVGKVVDRLKEERRICLKS